MKAYSDINVIEIVDFKKVSTCYPIGIQINNNWVLHKQNEKSPRFLKKKANNAIHPGKRISIKRYEQLLKGIYPKNRSIK